MASISTWIDDFGPVREDSNKVTEEDVQRVQAQSKQAKQVAQQIKKDKAINNQLAKFLWILMQKIENEELIKAIVSTFFKTTDNILKKRYQYLCCCWIFCTIFS